MTKAIETREYQHHVAHKTARQLEILESRARGESIQSGSEKNITLSGDWRAKDLVGTYVGGLIMNMKLKSPLITALPCHQREPF